MRIITIEDIKDIYIKFHQRKMAYYLLGVALNTLKSCLLQIPSQRFYFWDL